MNTLVEPLEIENADSVCLSDPTEFSESTQTWLRLLAGTRRVEQILDARLRQIFGVGLARFYLMSHLHNRPAGLGVKALSKLLSVSCGNVTGLTDSLIAQGYVAREIHPIDRRSHIVRLTDAGASRFGVMNQAHQQWVDAIFSDVDASCRDLRGILDKLLL